RLDWPWMVLVIAARRLSCPSYRFRAGDDLDQLFGDHRLTGSVVGQRLFADHFARIARGVVHRGHLRAVERGGILEQRAENLHRNVARQKLEEDFVLIGLVFVDHAVAIAGAPLEHRGDDLLRRRGLRDDRLEARKEQGADVERTLLIEAQDLVADAFGVFEVERAHGAQLDVLDDLLFVEPAKLLVALAADAKELHLLAFRHQRIRPLAREADDRRIERAAQAAFGGAYQQELHTVAAGSDQQSRRRAKIADAAADIA